MLDVGAIVLEGRWYLLLVLLLICLFGGELYFNNLQLLVLAKIRVVGRVDGLIKVADELLFLT